MEKKNSRTREKKVRDSRHTKIKDTLNQSDTGKKSLYKPKAHKPQSDHYVINTDKKVNSRFSVKNPKLKKGKRINPTPFSKDKSMKIAAKKKELTADKDFKIGRIKQKSIESRKLGKPLTSGLATGKSKDDQAKLQSGRNLKIGTRISSIKSLFRKK
ncbi:MAG: hypothetical protein ABIJ18_05805 [archaeon]